MNVNKIYQGDALETLRTFPDKCIDMAITSPPYYGLRDYGVDGQIGNESTFQEYINKLCDIFDEVKRVLKDNGTCWVNIGDSYDGNKKGKTDLKVSEATKHTCDELVKKTQLQNKCMLQIPARFAIEMTNRGWILRNEIIWCKPNAMPSSVKDRFTVDYEKIFFFSKSPNYFFEQQKEPTITKYSEKIASRPITSKMKATLSNGKSAGNFTTNKVKPDGKNKRCVWSINTKPFKEAHFATFPEKLVETPIKAGAKKGGIVLDIFMGSGTTGVVAKKLGRNYIGIELNEKYVEMAERRISKVYYQESLL